jgi:hypothetical protein
VAGAGGLSLNSNKRRDQTMSVAIPPLFHTASWCGAQLKHFSFTLYVFMEWCLVKRRNKFSLPLPSETLLLKYPLSLQ